MLLMGFEVKKLLLMVLLAAIVSGCDESPEQKEKNNKRDAIKLCWKEYVKKSLDENSKRFIAGACEKMEADFKNQYHSSP